MTVYLVQMREITDGCGLLRLPLQSPKGYISGTYLRKSFLYFESQVTHVLAHAKGKNRKIRNVVSNVHSNQWYVKSFIRDYELPLGRRVKTSSIEF